MAQPLARHVLAKFKTGKDGQFRNERLELERQKQAEFRAGRSKAGKQGAKRRWLSHSSAIANDSSPSPSPSPIAEREYVERPSLEEVQFHASTIGLGAWKAEDWYQEMEGCGWLDHNKRPVRSWKAILARVKTKWQSDGRPTSPPVAFNGKPGGYGGKPERKTHQFITDLQKEIERDK